MAKRDKVKLMTKSKKKTAKRSPTTTHEEKPANTPSKLAATPTQDKLVEGETVATLEEDLEDASFAEDSAQHNTLLIDM